MDLTSRFRRSVQASHLAIVLVFITTYRLSAQVGSKHFRIDTLATGVYAVIHRSGGYAICNSGIVDLGTETLVFDCFISPTAADDLKRVAEELTGHPVKYVINSHYHNDHIRGNQCFPGARILSTASTRRSIEDKDPQELASEKSDIPKRIEYFSSRLEQETDPHKKEEYTMLLEYFEAINSSFSTYKMTLPDSVIGDSTWLQGSARKVLLYCKGGGHTPSDLVLWLPSEHILFAGDLVFNGIHPWVGDGFVPEWLNYLPMLKALKPAWVVPGHGPVGNGDLISTMDDYLQRITALVDKAIQEGKSAEEITALPIPEPYRQWWLGHFHPGNLNSLYEARKSRK